MIRRFIFLIFISMSIDAQYKLGKDYELISNPLPVKKDGIVEVTEIFWYGCGGCYSFEPLVNSWKEDLPDYVNFSKMPITWGPIHQLHASLFHTIEALELNSSIHSAVFITIHKDGNMLSSQESIVKFLSKSGIEPETAEKYLNSFSIKQKVTRDLKAARQLRASSVPMIIIDGTYKIQSQGSFSDVLKVADHVIALQRPNS